MALINCSMEKETVIVSSGDTNIASLELEIIPDEGYVVAARDFVAGDNPDSNIIASITLSDTETTGGPQNDGSYTTSNKVKVTVDFEDGYTFTENVILDINPSGSATANHLVPVKLQGTFAVPGSPDKVTFTASSVEDFASSPSTTDFYAYDNPGDLVTIMIMTIAATSGDFIDEDPTIVITNPSDSTAENDYVVTRVNTFDSSDRLTQVVYTVKATIPKVSRSGDVITFAAAGDDIPGLDSKIYGYRMDTTPADLFGINRRLEVYADEGAEFRIKMERGTISGGTFTIDATDGIYLFDNSLGTIAEAFESSSSTVTYPSEIQAGGIYAPTTNPYTMTSSGVLSKNIVIPADTEDKVYRFTITPEGSTTVDPNAPGYLDVTPDPDVITFDITRNGVVIFEADTVSARTTTQTVEYYNYLDESIGTTNPRGKKETETDEPINEYRYELIVRDQVSDFHLPNASNFYILNNMNYTKVLNDGVTTDNDGIVNDPIIIAELRATSDGFFAGEIQSTGYDSHTHAEAHEPDTAIVLTLEQRQALTSKSALNVFSLSDEYAIVNDHRYFKIHFYTTDDTPVYTSQTILIGTDDGDVGSGNDNHQNTTVESTPAVDREYLYLNSYNLQINRWGVSDMGIDHDLDTFTSTSAPTATTLNILFNISELVKRFVNELGKAVGYTNSYNYKISQQVSTDGGAIYSKQNITTSTTNVKFTITGAFLNGQDRLPKDFNTTDYELLFEKIDSSSELDAATLTVTTPTLTLNDASSVDRSLEIGSFDIDINFGSTPTILASLSASESYFMELSVTHRFSDDYIDISDVEDAYGYSADDTEPATY